MRFEKDKSYMEAMIKKLNDELHARGWKKENTLDDRSASKQLQEELHQQKKISEDLLMKNQVMNCQFHFEFYFIWEEIHCMLGIRKSKWKRKERKRTIIGEASTDNGGKIADWTTEKLFSLWNQRVLEKQEASPTWWGNLRFYFILSSSIHLTSRNLELDLLETR